MPQTVPGRCLNHTTVFCHVVFIPSGLVWEKLRLGYLLTNKLSEEPVGGGWKIGGSTNGKLIRDRRPPYNKLPALHHWLLTLKLFQQNITAAALSFMRNKFKAPRKVFRYSPEVAWMNCANHYDDSECKDRRHTAMIAGSIEDTWRQIADRRGLLGSQPKR